MSKEDKVKDSYTPLADEKRTVVGTACAAWHLGRRPQTLRGWSCRGDGPLKPIQLNGRLAWRVDDIKWLLTSASVHAQNGADSAEDQPKGHV